eukprot:1153098-Pelagomonas_calceolata.AAC.7
MQLLLGNRHTCTALSPTVYMTHLNLLCIHQKMSSAAWDSAVHSTSLYSHQAHTQDPILTHST